MQYDFHPERVTMPPVFTPARTARFWAAVEECVTHVEIPTELAMAVHLKILAETLEVKATQTTQYGYLVGGMIARRMFHQSYVRDVRNSWFDMRTMPVKYLREFVYHLDAPFDEMAFQTLFTLHPAGIAAEYSGALNVSWRDGRGSLMSLAEAGATPDIVKSYWDRGDLLRSAVNTTMQAFGAAQVPGGYAARMVAETSLTPREIVGAWEAGLPFEYVKAMEA